MTKRRRSSLQPFQKADIARKRKLAALRDHPQQDDDDYVMDDSPQRSSTLGLFFIWRLLSDFFSSIAFTFYTGLVFIFVSPTLLLGQFCVSCIYFVSSIIGILVEYLCLVPFSFCGSVVKYFSEGNTTKNESGHQFEKTLRLLEKVCYLHIFALEDLWVTSTIESKESSAWCQATGKRKESIQESRPCSPKSSTDFNPSNDKDSYTKYLTLLFSVFFSLSNDSFPIFSIESTRISSPVSTPVATVAAPPAPMPPPPPPPVMAPSPIIIRIQAPKVCNARILFVHRY